MTGTTGDGWSAGDAYELYMGRWSRRVATLFLDRLAPGPGLDWIEVGCGTGALTREILARFDPRSVFALDASADFIAHARAASPDPRARFAAGDAQSPPFEAGAADLAVSALAINFVPDRAAALAQMARALRPGGRLAFYVWDYPGGGVGMIDAFWRAAASLDAEAAALDEARRFPFCTPRGLAADVAAAGLPEPEVAPLEAEAVFADFEDLWRPFTLGAGPAPAYCTGLPPGRRAALETRLRETLGPGPIRLPLRAWSVEVSIPD
ncbi:class I SAM-dependent methyltransferase [Albimonas sp. CAU 1670]|uniref:class I SAM-dependent methyltransferase n=1 Tax=Albimonas sp. CAU 1670 TaxID=3032599 RepID=UPI0023DB759E|nr:class I SAM-dependent methyltransferase [Albimonas sp. CAU 1670]MDF2233841.1 class I SAM-dependent methyltransferase [Albimonas sp. CAU 1670]